MCTILLAWRGTNGADIVLAANRDELIARPAAPPMLLNSTPPVAGGRDLMAGGTWLAVAADGRVCAVTNRRLPDVDEVVRDPNRLSRGDVPLHVLTSVGESGMEAYLRGLGPGRYNPVNVLYVSRTLAMVAAVDDTGPPRVTSLDPGLHVLTVHDIDDPERAKDAALREHVTRAFSESPDARTFEMRLHQLLSRHDTPSGEPLDAPCIHGDEYGTVSSSSVVVRDGVPQYRHAAGRPCITPFAPVEVLAGLR